MGMTPETQIANLLYRYTEAIDAGEFDSAANLFAHARLKVGPDSETDAAGMLALWRQLIIIHPDGTPRTKHVVTNPIVEVDGDTATCRQPTTRCCSRPPTSRCRRWSPAGTTTGSNGSTASGDSPTATTPSWISSAI